MADIIGLRLPYKGVNTDFSVIYNHTKEERAVCDKYGEILEPYSPPIWQIHEIVFLAEEDRNLEVIRTNMTDSYIIEEIKAARTELRDEDE